MRLGQCLGRLLDEHQSAVVLGVLVCLAVLANWFHTLGAIAHRSAGTEGESTKASATIADARDELARIGAERKALTFTPAFRPLDERVGLRTEQRGAKLFVCDVRLVA